MTDMPSTYESQQTTSTTTTSGVGGDIGLRIDYIKTIPGILKIVEVVLCILTFICASVWPWWGHIGGGWVQFVSIVAFLVTLALFILYLFGIVYKIPAMIPWPLIILSLIVFICSCVWWWGALQDWVQFVSISAFMSTLVYLILHLVNVISRFPGPWLLIEFIYYCVFTVFFLIAAIVAAARGAYHSSIGATAFFAFASTAVFAVDTFFQFRAWRSGQTEMTTTTTTTHTSHTTTNVETREAY